MAVSASAAFFVVVLMSATVTAAFAAVTVMMSATAAPACQVFDEVLYLFLCGLTVLNHFSCEVQQFACQRVVGIYRHTVFIDLHHRCHKLMILIVHQGDGGSLEDILVVEMTVDGEYIAGEFVYALGYIFAKCLRRFKGEVEGRAFL